MEKSPYQEAWQNALQRQRLVNQYLETINAMYDELRRNIENGVLSNDEIEANRAKINRLRDNLEPFCESIRKEVQFLESLVTKDAEKHN